MKNATAPAHEAHLDAQLEQAKRERTDAAQRVRDVEVSIIEQQNESLLNSLRRDVKKLIVSGRLNPKQQRQFLFAIRHTVWLGVQDGLDELRRVEEKSKTEPVITIGDNE